MEKTDIFNFREHLLTFIHTFGEIASIIVAGWMLGHILVWLSKLAINAITLRGVVGIRRVGQLLCPTVVINYDYGKLTRAAKRRQQEEKERFQEELNTLQSEEGSTTTLSHFPTTDQEAEDSTSPIGQVGATCPEGGTNFI